MKQIGEMTIPELEEHIANLDAEIHSASCPKCRRNRLRGKISEAQQRIIRLKREAKLAESKAAQEAAAEGGGGG